MTLRAGVAAAAAGAAAATYMAFEAQWPDCRRTDLAVPGLPAPWAGLTILHLSDVHAGLFPTNERSLGKVVSWAAPLEPDLVLLTGDILGDPSRSGRALRWLTRLHPPLGTFAVTGNHEYGLEKAPLARARDVSGLYQTADITLLRDACAPLPPRDGAGLLLCGADYLTGGFGLLDPAAAPGCRPATAASPAAPPSAGSNFSILLIHEPPASDSPLADHFPLAFAGHTHGGQLRVPSASGLRPLVYETDEFLSGVHEWGSGRLVVSRGVGTSFLPFRLFSRPEATLWRLV
jgi:predicted MPP superfamily phosphohydrolase